MNPEIPRAMREVIEAWENPDSPEALNAAIYQLKRVYREHSDHIRDKPQRRKPSHAR